MNVRASLWGAAKRPGCCSSTLSLLRIMTGRSLVKQSTAAASVGLACLLTGEEFMGIVLALASAVLIAVVLFDGFEAMVLPRRVTRTLRLTRFYYRGAWTLWREVGRRLAPGKGREYFLSLFGPFSLLGLFATWVLTLIFGFAVLEWSLGIALHTPEKAVDFGSYLYLSGVTFFTLGYGDVTPATALGRVLSVAEAGFGFGFMAVIIGYLPVLSQAFSQREVTISLLDARAGSPPSAAQVLLRLAQACSFADVNPFLAEWERWAAELLESHLSFPTLSFYRSQHDNQSWLAAVTSILDTCALLIVGVKDTCPYQAQLTFAMARHAIVDLALVFRTPPLAPVPDRLADSRLAQLREVLRAAGLVLHEDPAVNAKLTELRAMYEPYVNALAHFLLFTLPPILPARPPVDNWQTSRWMRRAPGIGKLPQLDATDRHFD
jgi:voltage-gated potassium channel Kch